MLSLFRLDCANIGLVEMSNNGYELYTRQLSKLTLYLSGMCYIGLSYFRKGMHVTVRYFNFSVGENKLFHVHCLVSLCSSQNSWRLLIPLVTIDDYFLLSDVRL